MQMPRRTGVPSRRAAHAALIVVLAMALQLAAAAGLRHRINHAWPAVPQQAGRGIAQAVVPHAARDAACDADDGARCAATRDASREPAPAHACQAYDAATLAAHLPAAGPAPLPLAAPSPRQSCRAPPPRSLAPASHSLARGPPGRALP